MAKSREWAYKLKVYMQNMQQFERIDYFVVTM